MKILRFAMLWLGLLAVPVTLAAQTAITTTTTSAAVTATDVAVSLTSDTGVVAGTFLYIDGELLAATSEIGTSARWNVRRGLGDGKTPAVAHANAARVYVMASGAAGESYYTFDVVSGQSCSVPRYLPRINTKTAQFADCEGGVWMVWNVDPVFVRDFTVRDNFDQGYFIIQDDMTAKSVTDDEDNAVLGSPLGLITYREELSKTISSWAVTDGELTISADDDNAEDGVEIVIGGDGSLTTEGVIVAGTQGACFAAAFSVADISDTDQLTVGWRQNEDFVDLADNMGYTIVNTVGINATDGSIVSEQEVSEATDSDDSGVNWADAETRALKVCISKAGVPTAYYSAAYTSSQVLTDRPTYTAITMTETGSTLTAGTQLYPFISFVQGSTAGADVNVFWIELTRIQ